MYMEPCFPLPFLAIIYAKPLGMQAITPWTLLATTLLISIGISMVYRPKKTSIKTAAKKQKVYMETPICNMNNLMMDFIRCIQILIQVPAISIPMTLKEQIYDVA